MRHKAEFRGGSGVRKTCKQTHLCLTQPHRLDVITGYLSARNLSGIKLPAQT